VQELMRRIGDHFTKEFDDHIDQLMDNLIDGTHELNPITLPKGMSLTDLRSWVRDGGLTREPGDPKKLTKEEKRDRAISKALPTEFKRTLGTLQNARRHTFYVPLARRGDHVLNATKTFEKTVPGGGQTGRTPGEFYFVDRQSFMDFMKKHEGEPIAKQPSTRWMNYDPATKTMVPSHEKEAGAKRVYFVTMQTRNVRDVRHPRQGEHAARRDAGRPELHRRQGADPAQGDQGGLRHPARRRCPGRSPSVPCSTPPSQHEGQDGLRALEGSLHPHHAAEHGDDAAAGQADAAPQRARFLRRSAALDPRRQHVDGQPPRQARHQAGDDQRSA
jgi:hypothetical protein